MCENSGNTCENVVKILLFFLLHVYVLFCRVDGSLPWHRVHTVNPRGPVGIDGTIKPGDHLIEVQY